MQGAMMDGMVRDGSWRGDRRGGGLGAGGRRRRWSAAEKAAIVAESFVAGAKVSEVARRHGLCANMLYAWRGQVLAHDDATGGDQKGAPIAVASPFVPVRVAGGFGGRADALADARPGASEIEIVLADASIRVAKGVDAATLSRVLAAVRGGRR
jgi:transposase